MNRVIIMGNLGSKPELNYTQGGTAVLKMSVATNERKKSGDNWVDHVEWHRITVWDKRAEGLAKILDKGSKVLVEGALRTSKYEKNGETRYSTEIIARNVELCGSKPNGGRGREPGEDDVDPNVGF